MTTQLQLFFLIFMRISTFFIISPSFSFKGMPHLMKVVLAAGVTLPVYTLINHALPGWTLSQFVVMGIKEIIFGAALGYVTQLFFTAVDIAGSFVDYQVGFSMAEVFDPSLGVSASYFGKVYYWIAMAIFFLTDIHHLLIRALVYSFDSFPVTGMSIGNVEVEGILKLFVLMFGMALRLAAPFLIGAILTEIVLGILSRTVPQINVLILSMPLKVLVALVLMMAFLPTLIRNIGDVFPQMLRYTNQFIQSFSI